MLLRNRKSGLPGIIRTSILVLLYTIPGTSWTMGVALYRRRYCQWIRIHAEWQFEHQGFSWDDRGMAGFHCCLPNGHYTFLWYCWRANGRWHDFQLRTGFSWWKYNQKRFLGTCQVQEANASDQFPYRRCIEDTAVSERGENPWRMTAIFSIHVAWLNTCPDRKSSQIRSCKKAWNKSNWPYLSLCRCIALWAHRKGGWRIWTAVSTFIGRIRQCKRL